MPTLLFSVDQTFYLLLSILFSVTFALQWAFERYHDIRKLGHLRLVFHRMGFAIALLHLLRGIDPHAISTFPQIVVDIFESLYFGVALGAIVALSRNFYIVSYTAQNQTAPVIPQYLFVGFAAVCCILLLSLVISAHVQNLESLKGWYYIVFGILNFLVAVLILVTGLLLRKRVYGQVRRISPMLQDRMNRLLLFKVLLLLLLPAVCIEAIRQGVEMYHDVGVPIEFTDPEQYHVNFLDWIGFMYLSIFLLMGWIPLSRDGADTSSVDDSLQVHMNETKVDASEGQRFGIIAEPVDTSISGFVKAVCCQISHSTQTKRDSKRIARRLSVSYLIAITILVILAAVELIVLESQLGENSNLGAETASNLQPLAMTVNKLTGEIWMYVDQNNTPAAIQSGEILQDTVTELQDGVQALLNTPEIAHVIRLEFYDLIPIMEKIVSSTSIVMDEIQGPLDKNIIGAQIEHLSVVIPEWFQAVDGVNAQLAGLVDDYFSDLQDLQAIFFTLTIAACLFQVFCVFVPTTTLVQAALKLSQQELTALKAMQTNANKQLNAIHKDLDDIVVQKFNSVLSMRQFFEDAVSKAWQSYQIYLKLHFYDTHVQKSWGHVTTIISRRTQELESLVEAVEDSKHRDTIRDQLSQLVVDHRQRHIASIELSGQTKEWILAKWKRTSVKFRQTNRIRLQTIESRCLTAVAKHGIHKCFARFFIFEVEKTKALTYLIGATDRSGERQSVVAFGGGDNDPRTRVAQMFEECLKKEHSFENYQFIKAVVLFKRVASTKKEKMARSIYEKFIQNDALSMINLDSGTKARLDREFQAKDRPVPEWVFAEAETVIMELMASDSLKRFLQSPACLSVHKKLQTDEAEVTSLLSPLNSFSEELKQIVEEQCMEAVKGGHFDLAQQIWVEGSKLMDDITTVSLPDTEAFLASCRLEETKIQELWAQQDWKNADARAARLKEVMDKVLVTWIKEMLSIAEKYGQRSRGGLSDSIIPALLRLEAIRKLEKLHKNQEYLYRKAAVEPGDSIDTEDSENSTYNSKDSKQSEEKKSPDHGKKAKEGKGKGKRSDGKGSDGKGSDARRGSGSGHSKSSGGGGGKGKNKKGSIKGLKGKSDQKAHSRSPIIKSGSAHIQQRDEADQERSERLADIPGSLPGSLSDLKQDQKHSDPPTPLSPSPEPSPDPLIRHPRDESALQLSGHFISTSALLGKDTIKEDSDQSVKEDPIHNSRGDPESEKEAWSVQ